MGNHDDDAAVGVHITNFSEMVFRTEEKEPEHFSLQTLVIEPGQSGGAVGVGGQGSAQQLLALDPMRKDAAICAVDNPIALCDSPMQANRPWNTIGSLLVPDGAFLAAGQTASLSGTGPVWVSCQTATRVTVIINRRSS